MRMVSPNEELPIEEENNGVAAATTVVRPSLRHTRGAFSNADNRQTQEADSDSAHDRTAIMKQ